MRSLLSVAPHRWVMLVSGFVAWGVGLVLFVRANLGLGPWDAFHQGLGFQTGISIGQASVVAGLAILLLWIPLRERPGIGTILNVLIIGTVTDIGLRLIPENFEPMWLRIGALFAGMLCVGIGSALYLPAGLGAGPRDGLMLGLNRKFGWSLRVARTAVEASALGIGPVVQFSLKHGKRWLPDWRLPAPAKQ